MSLRTDAAELSDELIALRRELHQIPEIGLHLPRTQEKVLAALDGLPMEVTSGKSLTSVVGVLRGGAPGPVVLLRGDMDALPVTERSGVDFTSRHEGSMHACGHDLHTAGLVGAARLLSAHRQELAGDVVFMFQPGEEGHDGAGHMIEEGVLEAAGRPVERAYGLHVMAGEYPRGLFVARPGTLMAASDGLLVRVIGAGGHGSSPHRALDPVPAACEMVNALQTMVTRGFSIFDPVVVTVGMFHAGTRRNVIPDEAVFEATVRSFSPQAREKIQIESVRLCERIGAAYGLEVQARCQPEYPLTVNNAQEFDFVAATTKEVFGEERFQQLADPIAGSEDFSRVLDRVPGAYVFLGATRSADPQTAPGNHSPLATFDDSVLSDGAALLAELALRRLTP
ncbi:M20 family metallopeptidase [Fodinicola feengrottensis]|uniref:M20 family metallopeptidase n=1 Tax=Fodinicola feengrottensis TaxID=435914 RepID=A0ABN2HGY3_9ACTN